MSPESDRAGQRGAGILAVVALVAVGVVLVLLVASAFASYHVRNARAGWNDTFGPWEEILERYPATEANASALELERLAAGLGVHIVPRSVDDDFRRVRPSEGLQKSFGALKREGFPDYLNAQLSRVGRTTLDAPPPRLVAYMNENADGLLALRSHLVDAPVPVWESDLSRAQAAPIPNLLGQIDLTKLLTTVALARAQAGDTEGALLDVEASWKLTRSIADSPILICQLIAIASTRMQIGVLRHIPDVPEEWVARLEQHDFRESFLQAMRFEGRIWLEVGSDEVWTRQDNWWTGITRPVMRPYNKICLADISDAWRRRMENLAQVPALCDYDLSEHDADLDIPIPSWNQVGKVMVPNLVSAIDRLARLELDLELTRLLLEADRTEPAAGVRPSLTCPRDGWTYTTTDDGVEIAFNREISWPGQRGAILPTRVRLN